MVEQPRFLDLPDRPSRPRDRGITHVLDKGRDLAGLRSVLAAAGPYVDVWKFGWGTAYLDRDLDAKLDVLRSEGITSCTGGTLLEVAWVRDRVGEFLEFVTAAGFDAVEVSDGSVDMGGGRKSELVKRVRHEGFTVFAEVGRKTRDAPVTVDDWSAEAVADLEAGADWIVTEGRESGTVGLFRADGSVRDDLVDGLIERCGAERLLFEAPRPAQQGWLINRLGPDVNLGNVALDEILGVEALRLGLRADTIGLHDRKRFPRHV